MPEQSFLQKERLEGFPPVVAFCSHRLSLVFITYFYRLFFLLSSSISNPNLSPLHKHLRQAALFSLPRSQPPVNLLRKDSKRFFLNLIIPKQQGEKILVLVQPLNQSVVNIVKISEFKVFFCVVFCACF